MSASILLNAGELMALSAGFFKSAVSINVQLDEMCQIINDLSADFTGNRANYCIKIFNDCQKALRTGVDMIGNYSQQVKTFSSKMQFADSSGGDSSSSDDQQDSQGLTQYDVYNYILAHDHTGDRCLTNEDERLEVQANYEAYYESMCVNPDPSTDFLRQGENDPCDPVALSNQFSQIMSLGIPGLSGLIRLYGEGFGLGGSVCIPESNTEERYYYDSDSDAYYETTEYTNQRGQGAETGYGTFY